LAGERRIRIRCELVDGERYAMAGAAEAHKLIALNGASRLRQAVRSGSGNAQSQKNISAHILREDRQNH